MRRNPFPFLALVALCMSVTCAFVAFRPSGERGGRWRKFEQITLPCYRNADSATVEKLKEGQKKRPKKYVWDWVPAPENETFTQMIARWFGA
jgi:hypothetical protein